MATGGPMFQKLCVASSTDVTILGISFVAACLLSTWPGNWMIRGAYNRILGSTKGPANSGTMKQWLEAHAPDSELAEFRSKTAWMIGALERIIYIIAFFFGQPGLITGALILKAFFAWTHQRAPKSDDDTTAMYETIAHYHTYLIGNFLSLLLAIFLGLASVHWFPALIVRLSKAAC
jgi:hypothetical protein